tara:strand:+ start:554 stop:1258 length:705 start_codon:yes stop_codon:yes gene_type:complete
MKIVNNLLLLKNYFTIQQYLILPIILLLSNFAICQKGDKKKKKPEFKIQMFDSSEKIIPLKKTSKTIGKCCQVGKALSKLTGGRSDVYLTQSELNNDGSYTIFFVSEFQVGFDIELTQFGVENPTSKISSFHILNKEKFMKLLELMQSGYKNFKAGLDKRIMYADVSEVLIGGSNEGDKLILRFHNKQVIKYVAFQLFEKETGYKTSGRPIFSQFIGQLFGNTEIIDYDSEFDK